MQPEPNSRRCHACGGTMEVDAVNEAAGIAISTSFACRECASISLVLSPVTFGGLYGSTVFCGVAAVYFALQKQPNAWVGSVVAVGLGLLFVYLAALRIRDERRNPKV